MPSTATPNADDASNRADQPIGYWAGEAYRRISAGLIRSLAEVGVSQPQWWVLIRLADAPRPVPRERVVTELQPYSDNEEGRDVDLDVADLVDRGAVRDDNDALTITEAGTALLAAARTNNERAHRSMRAALTDDEYAAMIDGLRKIVGALGGDPTFR
ncbi:MarR family winged helix-turn-helix transcriptional regulator [Microlunatus soli]|uniref:DNA-binding transcriptional regulator, MarR family n=1 Tax=Microlunatus soli TaxID=630515 RepID=A0A1H1TBW2_9ACTN|nr:MarR family winged helix-turn-helix transcriptional regulator [Microlunatus soli]SDS57795.1 DNA-binding transcriptional regulator, MarR family [Microlunatus soli]